MENFTILGLMAGSKKGEEKGRVAEIHLIDKGVDDDFYISLSLSGDNVCIYDTDNTTYHVQINDGIEVPCDEFDEIMQFCCTIETTKTMLLKGPDSPWCNLYRFLLKAAESDNPDELIAPFIGKNAASLPAR